MQFKFRMVGGNLRQQEAEAGVALAAPEGAARSTNGNGKGLFNLQVTR